MIEARGLQSFLPGRCRTCEICQQVKHLAQARAQHVLSSHGPQQTLDDTEHGKTKEDTDHTIAGDGGAEGRAKVL